MKRVVFLSLLGLVLIGCANLGAEQRANRPGNPSDNTRVTASIAREQTECAGLSGAFRTPIGEFKGGDRPIDEASPVERQILEDLLKKPSNAFLNKQARVAGSAAACDIDIRDELKKLRQSAAAAYPAGSPESAKFVEAIECTVARYERLGREQSEQDRDCDYDRALFETVVQRGENPWRPGATASLPTPKPKYVTWQEEVKLNDGRVIVVTQKKRCEGAYTGKEFAKCIAREAWLTINLPEFSSKEIVWHERLSPKIVNIHEGKLYVVGIPPTCLEFDFYGKPQPDYIGFIFESGGWRRIPFNKIPKAIYDTNLLTAGLPPEGTEYLTLERKQSKEINGKPTISKHIKRIDPTFKSNC